MHRTAPLCLLAALCVTPAGAQSPPAAERAPRPAALSGPTFDEHSVDRLKQALAAYLELEARGGWPMLPRNLKLAPEAKGAKVAELRRRLALTGDLAPEREKGDAYDKDLVEGIKRFQQRHGLVANGTVGAQTLSALNVPVGKRLRQLNGSLKRLSDTDFTFAKRYVVVNLPAATAEAVANGQVEARYIVVVGNTKHPSPTLTTGINQVILNPAWTVPLSIVKNEIVPKMRRDPTYLARMHMRVIAGRDEVSPKSIYWSSGRVPNYVIRQDAGAWNALGAVKIDMPNPHAVYLHDTNNKNVFDAQYRFLSHGCARVKNVRDLAAWVLAEVPGWGRAEIEAGIDKGARQEIKLPRRMPVAWIYLTGWRSADGVVQFRDDIYGLDDASADRQARTAQRASVSYLDAR
jgi:L,D-transpeptidase YcbB